MGNLDVGMQCKHELKAFCTDVTEGQSRLMACMVRHRYDVGFGLSCRQAIENTADMKQVLTRAGSPPLQRLHAFLGRSTFDKYGGLLLAGTLCFVALLSFGLAHCLIRRSLLKRAYVTVGQPEYLES